MKLPFISRRRHEAALGFLAAVQRKNVDDALAWALDERAARRRAEAELGNERDAVLQQGAYRLADRERDGRRLERLCRAVAAERRQAAVQRRVIRRLTDQLLDATGNKGEHLYPAARTALGITDKEDA
ncbi:hypothetical protein [Streptomyces sp. NPDC096068]|uniref:hypothetical protein n=1 Tax=Streptomyces sp. NPDC096068 TaxID=3155424 RepID=UPI00332E63D3